MRYDEKDILFALKECKIKNEVAFIGVLPHFTFDRVTKKVVGHHIAPKEGVNDLEVFPTELVDLNEDLASYFQQLELTGSDILVFCINQVYIPKDNQIRLKIISLG